MNEYTVLMLKKHREEQAIRKQRAAEFEREARLARVRRPALAWLARVLRGLADSLTPPTIARPQPPAPRSAKTRAADIQLEDSAGC